MMILRRSCFLVPVNNLDLVSTATASSVDFIVLDLEDSVPVSRKAAARAMINEAVVQAKTAGKNVAVRINSISTGFVADDILAAVKAGADEIVVPKVNRPNDVQIIEAMVEAAEDELQSKQTTGLQALIETASGVEAVHEIAYASKRLTVLQFGRADYFADIGANKSFSMDDSWAITLYPRSRIVVAATAAGIDPVDTVFPNINDVAGLKNDASRAAGMGFKGKWVINQSQIGIVNDIFTPSADEIRKAKRLIDAYEKSQMVGVGSITVDDVLIDRATVLSASKLKFVAERLGLWNKA